MSTPPLIKVHGLVKHYRVPIRPPGVGAAVKALFHRDYRVVRAVDGIDFEIEAGERVGFLGPNGAGKTTTLKMLAGLLYPTSGELSVAGFRPAQRHPDFLRRIMFVAGQKQQLLWDLPPAETFELNRAIYGVSRQSFRRVLDEIVSVLELEPLLEKPTRQLSLGERMKCELAAALIHSPTVLFLDEPTIGLDVTMQAALRSFIRRYNEEHGATVLLTSHYMVDVAALAPRVLVIDHGHVTFDGQLQALVRRVRPSRRLTLRLGAPPSVEALVSLEARVVSLSDGIAVLEVGEESLKPLIARALERLPVVDLSVEEPPLEEVISELFARHPGELGRGDGGGRGDHGGDSEGLGGDGDDGPDGGRARHVAIASVPARSLDGEGG